MAETPSFSGLKITNYYKYILYLCGVIFILSLFFEVKDFSNEYVRNIAFWVLITSLSIWFIQYSIYIYNKDTEHSDHEEILYVMFYLPLKSNYSF